MLGCRFYLGALCRVQDPLFLLQVSGYDHGHVHRILLEAILQRDPLQPCQIVQRNQQTHKRPSHLQVSLDLADVVLLQELALQGEATVLVIQLSQEVVESNPSQGVLHRHGFPAAPPHEQPV